MKPRQDWAEFKARVREWAGRLNVTVGAVYIRPMRHKWASCSTAGTLSFNEELIGLDGEIGDYVIVHELLHLVVPNQGKLWRSLMPAHLGDYAAVEGRLADAAQMQAR